MRALLFGLCCIAFALPAQAKSPLREVYAPSEIQATDGAIAVVATGRAPMADRGSIAGVSVKAGSEAKSAVEASRDMDAALAMLKAIGQQFGVEPKIASQGFQAQRNYEAEQAARAAATKRRPGEPPYDPASAPPVIDTNAIPPKFTWGVSVDYEIDPAKVALLVDALAKAKMREIQARIVHYANDSATLDSIDPSVWRDAASNGLVNAQIQAEALAEPMNAFVGLPLSVRMLGRGLTETDAWMTMEVRYPLVQR